MKVLIISSSFKKVNLFSVDFLNGFNNSGIDAFLLTDYSDIQHSKIINLLNKKNNLFDDYLFLIKKKLQRIRHNYSTNPKYYFSDLSSLITRFSTRQIAKKVLFQPDAIILLSNDNFISYKNLYELSSKIDCPVYILMIDMASITGGCHYAWSCKGYQNNCISCPAIYKNPGNLAYKNLVYKKKWISKTNLSLVTASYWQYKQATISSLFQGKPIYKVLTGFDENYFCPIDKKQLRLKYGIPAECKLVLFGANDITEERKGLKYFAEALLYLKNIVNKNNDIHILFSGKFINYEHYSFPFPHHYIGMIPYENINVIYQMSDLFVCSSIEDSGPTMINQSILCGTPVVTFDMGVAQDLIFDGKSGYIAPLANSFDLALYIQKIIELEEHDYIALTKETRKIGLQKCSINVNIAEWRQILQQ